MKITEITLLGLLGLIWLALGLPMGGFSSLAASNL